MSLAATALNQIIIMFLLILVGALCYKLKLINKDTNKSLSNLVLMLVNPVVVFHSYQRAFEKEMLMGLLISIILAVLTHVFGILCSYIFLHSKREDRIGLERFAVVYSNCGFMGIPLVNGVFGSEGVFYVTAYLTVFNLFVWTQGVILVTGKKDKSTIAKAFLNPSIIAALVGFAFFTLRLSLPNVVLQSVEYIASLNTPLAMLVAGVTIIQNNIIKVFINLRIYFIAFIKLLLVPIAMLLLFQTFRLSQTITLTAVLAAACPTGAMGTLFALRYGKDSGYASQLFTMTTILSMLTIPIVMTIAEAIS